MTDDTHEDFITVTHGMSGYFAVWMTWTDEFGGFWEPYTTGIGRYPTAQEAHAEARDWAADEELEYKASKSYS